MRAVIARTYRKLFGHSRCLYCGRKLTTRSARGRGYGATCARKHHPEPDPNQIKLPLDPIDEIRNDYDQEHAMG